MEKIKTIIVGNRVRAVDFNDIIKSVEHDVVDRLWDMDLLDNLKPTCKVFRRLFLYNVIKATCDFILSYKSEEKLLFIVSSGGGDLELFEYCENKESMAEFIDKAAKNISRNLPINFYSSDMSVSMISDLDSSSGEYVDFASDAMNTIQRKNIKTFEKIKKFVNDNGLTFLSESYFKDIRTKNILFA